MKCKSKNNDFIIVGRVVPHKKIEKAIELFLKIKEIIPKAKLKIIGSMPNEVYNSFLNQQIELFELKDSVEFCGLVEDKELKNYYNNSFGYINASSHEGFGVPLIEAIYHDMVVFVQRGHALEELLDRDMDAIDFNDIKNIDIKSLLKTNIVKNSKEHVLKVLEKNNFFNWNNILHKGLK